MSAVLIFLPGILLAGGAVVFLSAFRPQHGRLTDALGALDHDPATELPGPTSRRERLGAWWLRRRPGSLSAGTLRALRLQGRTPALHLTFKLRGLLVGLFVPSLLGLAGSLVLHSDPRLPLALALVAAVVGFFVPDLALRGHSKNLASDATEALLTYFDLVTLERMANQSATQSLHAAAAVSDNAIFGHIRAALERARLQQRMPFPDLKRVGHDLELPALVDLADVMRLDESGAALSQTLRARVKELRDAHVTAMKIDANRVSERMTVFMVVPAMVFGVILLVPPIMKLVVR